MEKRNDLGGAPPFNTDDVQEAGSVCCPQQHIYQIEQEQSHSEL